MDLTKNDKVYKFKLLKISLGLAIFIYIILHKKIEKN